MILETWKDEKVGQRDSAAALAATKEAVAFAAMSYGMIIP